MEELPEPERRMLISAIASREGTAREIASKYGYEIPWLREFTKLNEDAITEERERLDVIEELETRIDALTPQQLDDLWISNKFERLRRYQIVSEKLYEQCKKGLGDSTSLRELRAYMLAAANELGQLLHRGSGDAGTGDVATYEIEGVDLGNLK